MNEKRVEEAFVRASERYAELGVDTEAAVAAADAVPLSIHCWQGDDVGGFERSGSSLDGGGIQVTGDHPGKARCVDELRADLEEAVGLVPGAKRVNLHAIYGEFGGRKVDRDAVELSHFAGWIDWAAARGLRLDFNGTFFSHPLAAEGYTLSHRDPAVRDFWVEHARRCRAIGAGMGAAQGGACTVNLWVPDGAKDSPVDRMGYRDRLIESLDRCFAEKFPAESLEDSVEGKLFGIGSESFVVGSHELYLGYAATRRIFLTIDMGHYHPTELVADKISSVLRFVPGVLLHVSRGVRWDSDHVVVLSDELSELCRELARSGELARVRMGLDYFDGSINRIGAWSVGARSARKALLAAFLEPRAALLAADEVGDGFARLALLEEAKTLPWSSVWDEYCRRAGVVGDPELIASVEGYERKILAERS